MDEGTRQTFRALGIENPRQQVLLQSRSDLAQCERNDRTHLTVIPSGVTGVTGRQVRPASSKVQDSPDSPFLLREQTVDVQGVL